MDSNYIIKNAYNYIDNYALKNANLMQNIHTFLQISKPSDTIKPIYEFYDINKNILFKAECEYIGIAYTNVDKDILWVWAWANPQISKNHTLLSRKLLQYGLDINPSNNNIDIFLKSILTNSRMKLSAIELELIISLSLYISKKEGVLKIPINDKGINSVHWFMVHKFIR